MIVALLFGVIVIVVAAVALVVVVVGAGIDIGIVVVVAKSIVCSCFGDDDDGTVVFCVVAGGFVDGILVLLVLTILSTLKSKSSFSILFSVSYF